MELKLPELGENIETVDVSAVLVSEGDEVHRDQPVIEVETEKASLEVPSSCDGRVKQLLVSKGDKLSVGQVILVIEATSPLDAAEESGEVLQLGAARGSVPVETREGSTAMEPRLYEVAPPAPVSARERPATPPRSGIAQAPPATDATETGGVVAFPARTGRAEIGRTVAAAPSVRALARELGIDIHQVAGRGPGGRITREEVKAHAKRLLASAAGAVGGPAPLVAPPLPAFSQWGEVAHEPLTALRRATARNLTQAWSTVPHVTQCDRADVTQLEELRRNFNQRREAEGCKLSVTACAVKLCSVGLRQFPKFNASLDLAAGAIVYKRFYNVGVAVDTERGLLVPVIRNVERKSLLEVARELNELAERARGKKLRPEEMAGASFTVSNLGGLGTTWFSPIVNWPEVAILGIGRAETQAVHRGCAFEPRLLLPLSLSYDHRLIDGADAARFLRWIAEALEQPLLLLLEGER